MKEAVEQALRILLWGTVGAKGSGGAPKLTEQIGSVSPTL